MADEPTAAGPPVAGGTGGGRRDGRSRRGAEEAGRPGLRARDHRLRLPLLRVRRGRPGGQHAPAVPQHDPHDQAALHRQARDHPPAARARGRRRRRLRRRLSRGRVPLPQGQPLGAQAGRVREEAPRRGRPRAGARRDVQHVVGDGRQVRRGRDRVHRAHQALGPNPARRDGVSPLAAAREAAKDVAMPDEAPAGAAGRARPPPAATSEKGPAE